MDVKKEYPLQLLEIIEPIVDQYRNYIIPDRTSANYKLKDITSNFYFEIKPDVSIKDGYYSAAFTMKPESKSNTDPTTLRISYSKVGEYLKLWLDIVKKSTEIKTIYDDPIVNSFQDEFIKALNIESSDKQPIHFTDIPKLEEYIKFIEKEAKEDNTPDNQEIRLICKDITANITKESKFQIFKKIARIWALFAKTKGYSYTKRIMTKLIDISITSIMEEGVKGLIGLV